MIKGLLGSMVVLLASVTGLLAQSPTTPGVGAPTTGPIVRESEISGAPARVWGSTEYLLWWVKSGPLPYPLVTTGPGDTANPGTAGFGGVPTLTGPTVNFGAQSGARVTLGTWLVSDNSLGIEGTGIFLPKTTKSYRASSDANGNPVLTFRYLDPPDANGVTAEDAFQASVPPGNPFGVGPFAGRLAIVSSTRLWGTEASLIANLADGGNARLQLLGGFRYADLDENLSLQFQRGAIDGAVVVFQGNPFPAPSFVSSVDNFHVRNQFYGGQVGVRGEVQLGSLFVGATGKVALGSTHEMLSISGISSVTTGGGATTAVAGGQFAGPSNIGRYTGNEFTVIPEVEVKVGYQLTRALRCYLGYDFLYWSRVLRPGNQVDLIVDTRADQVDPNFVPGTRVTFPQPRFNRSDFWSQGLTFGLELNF
jgi:hypothetical protein